jgi:hypothetical protein
MSRKCLSICTIDAISVCVALAPVSIVAMFCPRGRGREREIKMSDGRKGFTIRTHGNVPESAIQRLVAAIPGPVTVKRDDQNVAPRTNETEEQQAIDWALGMWGDTDRGIFRPGTENTVAELHAMHRLNDPRELAKLLRDDLHHRGIDAREPGDQVPGKDGEFVTVGSIDGVDGDLLEIDRPEQCESFTMAQGRKLLANLRKGMDVELALRGGK